MTEERFIQKAKKENFGFFLTLGGIYSWWTAISFFIVASIQTVLFFYTAYLKRNEIEGFTESLHFALFLIIVSPYVIIGRTYKPNIEAIYLFIGKGFYNYEETLSEKFMKIKSDIDEKVKRNKKLFSFVYMFLVACVGGSLSFARPIACLIFGLNDDDKEFDGIQKKLPFVCWYPVDTREPFYFALCFVFQYAILTLTPCVVLQMVITFICFSEEIIGQLDVISSGFEICFERAENMRNIEGGKKGEIDPFLCICLNHSVKHHHLMIKLFDDLQFIYFYIIFLLMIGSTFLLCLCGLNFMRPEVSLSSKIHFGIIMLTETVNIFIFCYYGERIMQKSSLISFGLYESEWIKKSNKAKIYLSLVHSRCLQPLRLSAGGFMDASLPSFLNVLSSSYSYFNLLNLLNSQE